MPVPVNKVEYARLFRVQAGIFSLKLNNNNCRIVVSCGSTNCRNASYGSTSCQSRGPYVNRGQHAVHTLLHHAVAYCASGPGAGVYPRGGVQVHPGTPRYTKVPTVWLWFPTVRLWFPTVWHCLSLLGPGCHCWVPDVTVGSRTDDCSAPGLTTVLHPV